TTMIQVVVGTFLNQNLVIKQAFDLPMPTGCFEDGKLLNESRLATSLADALAYRKIKAKHAIISMNSSQIINRDLFIPNVEAEELETVIRYELQQYLPINLEDYQIRYLLTDDEDAQGQKRVFVSAVPDRMLNAYYQMLKQAGLQPYALELPLISLRKLVKYMGINQAETLDKQTVAFLDLGQENLNLSIYHQGNIDFTRLIRNGGRVIDEALRREGMKNDQVLQYKQEQLDVNQEDLESIHPDVKQSLDQLIYEIEKFLQFYRNNNQNKQLEILFIYGGCAQMNGLAAYLETKVKIPVQVVNKLDKIEFQFEIEQENKITSYLNAISSVIRVEA
ncbi:MAG: type IV pilus assembly protein PilM, partial [Culicoidibacterales bacterium]